jgi:hypothetical protein
MDKKYFHLVDPLVVPKLVAWLYHFVAPDASARQRAPP